MEIGCYVPKGAKKIIQATWKSQTQHIGCLSSSHFSWWVSSVHFVGISVSTKWVGFYKMHMWPSSPNSQWLQNDSASWYAMWTSRGSNMAKWLRLCIVPFWACAKFIPGHSNQVVEEAVLVTEVLFFVMRLWLVEPFPSTPSNCLDSFFGIV